MHELNCELDNLRIARNTCIHLGVRASKNPNFITHSVVSSFSGIFRENADTAHNGAASADLASKLRHAPIILLLSFRITILKSAFSKDVHNLSTLDKEKLEFL